MKIKKYYTLIALSVLLIASNILIFWFSKNNQLEMRWVGFSLVWLNLIISWVTFGRKKDITYLFLAGSAAILIFLLVNNYWVSTRIL